MGACGDCGIWSRLIAVAAGIAAVVMTALTGASCEYARVEPDDSIGVIPVFGDLNVTSGGTVGLFKVHLDKGNCRRWDGDEQDEFDIQMEFARYGTLVSLFCGVCGVALVWMEFACCQVPCSRCLVITLYLFAMIGIGLSALIYASDTCQNPGKGLGSGPYPCRMETGTIYAIVAFALYLFVNILLCVTPKPEPTCKKLKEKEEVDPCCPCFRHIEKDEEEDDEEEDEEEQEEVVEGKNTEKEQEGDDEAVVNDEEEDESEEEPKPERRGFFAFWRRDKKEEEEEEASEEEEEANSTPSDYHESAAEPDEIPHAVMVGSSDQFFSQRHLVDEAIVEEERPSSQVNNTWASSFYFWPRGEPATAVEAEESDTKDLFFDAQVSARDVEGGNDQLSAEVY